MRNMMHKNKLNSLQPWILANSPGSDNTCECFKFKMPSNKWVAIARFETKGVCQEAITHCENLFMKNPINELRHKRRLKKMGMGMMR